MNSSLFFYPKNFFLPFSKRKLLLCALFVILEDQKGLGKQKHANYDFECSISISFEHKGNGNSKADQKAKIPEIEKDFEEASF